MIRGITIKFTGCDGVDYTAVFNMKDENSCGLVESEGEKILVMNMDVESLVDHIRVKFGFNFDLVPICP